MHKRIAWTAFTIGVTLLATGVAVSATPGAATDSAATTVARRAPAGPLTIQRLMQLRIDWTLRVSRLMAGLESPPEVYGTQTIVDEPDPTSARPPEAPPSEGPKPVERNENTDNEGSSDQQAQSLG